MPRNSLADQFDYTDSLAPEMFDRLSKGERSEPVVLAPYAATVFVMNTKAGLLADRRLRHEYRHCRLDVNPDYKDGSILSVHRPMKTLGKSI